MTSESDDDIVTRLRVLNHHAKKLAENESLHDIHRDALTRCENLTWESANEIKRLREKVGRLEALPAHLEREIQRLTDAQESTEYALRVVTDELTKARAEILRLRAPRIAE